MSGKSKKTNKNSGGKTIVWIVFAVLLATVIALLLLIRSASKNQSLPEDLNTGNTADTEVNEPSADSVNESESINIGSGIKIDGVLSYTGRFAEDRTDENVTDVLAIRVTNSGEKYIQTMDIVIPVGDGEAQFSLSTLMPGESVIVPEKNRMPYIENPDLKKAVTQNVAFFSETPSLCEDKIGIDCLDGVINVTNISDADITGDIVIYYKTKVDGVYYGGVTYRMRIEGGLEAGEIRQGAAAHFDTENSAVVFVTCG